MLHVLDFRGDRRDPRGRLPRASWAQAGAVREVVANILADVRESGDAGVRRYSAQFDGWDGQELAIDDVVASQAAAELDAGLRAALERAADQVRWFHERSRPPDWTAERDGAVLGVRHRPLRRVGVYVPSSLAPLVSTAIMTIVPARVAGVDEVVLCTPPNERGEVSPPILAAVEIAGGADQRFRIGGAQAIAAMAYGTESVPPCDKIVGPGSVYSVEAKRQVAAEGVCGTDAPAGPTEVAIIADAGADSALIAADLVAQAEHDPLATCLLITSSPELLERTEQALKTEVAATRHRERVRQALDGQGTCVLVDDLTQAVEVANAFAAEHLEVQTEDAARIADGVRAAGAVFVGAHTPVSLGDYCAGPNHTLPTGGAARFTGGLRTADFLVPVNWVQYDRDALAELAEVTDALSAAEDLPAHGRAVRARLER